MSRKRGQKAPVIAGDPADPQGFPAMVARYLEWMQVSNYSAATIQVHAEYLASFTAWCAARSLTQPKEITKPILERYQRHLFYHRKANGEPLSFHGQHIRLSSLRVFFRWLARQNYLLYNPASDLQLPRLEKRLPKYVLTANEVEQVLSQPTITEPLGLRDRAMMETLYSTGMRRAELIHLRLYDMDLERGTVLIRQGKGKKDRTVPIGERASAWVCKYLESVRPTLTCEPDEGWLFLTKEGEQIAAHTLSQTVKDYINDADIGKKGSCHLFRHSMATLMLENGADIRFIQAILGHSELSTTQIYTHVSIRKLQEIHALTHPAKLARTVPTDHASAPDGSDDIDPTDALLAVLDAEADEEES